MHIIERYPLIRPLSAYACGICIACTMGDILPFPSAVMPFFPAGLFLGVLLLWLLHGVTRYRTRKIFGLWMTVLFTVFGMNAALHTLPHAETAADEVPRTYRGILVEPPALRARTVKLTLQLQAVAEDSLFRPVEEKCLLSLERSETAENLNYGDELLFKSRLQPVEPPLNEAAFDYRKYLARRGICRQAYASSGQWTLSGTGNGNPLLLQTSRWRSRLVFLLKNGSLSEDSKGLVATMLLGDDSFLDPEVSGTYSMVGVSHILCVSGMHVGIIYLMFDYLLFFLRRNRVQRMLKALLLVAVVWLYACMVALSPSVVRSAVMFSFVSVGKVFRQQTQTYNSLLTSAFLMLLLRPLLLFEVGFLMSYLAVWGIVCLQPRLQRCWRPRFRLAAYLWGIWSVSIAAQLFTSPISIYCFHQFPTWFLLSNVVVVTLAPFVIGLGMAYLLCSFSPLLSGLVAKVLDVLIRIMHGGVAAVAAIPGASIQDIYLSPLQLALLYAALFLLLSFLVKKRASVLLAVLCCLCAVAADGVLHVFRNQERQEVRLFAVARHAAVEAANGRDALFFTDVPEDYAGGNFDFSVKGSQLKNGSTQARLLLADTLTDGWVKSGTYFQIAGLSFWVPQGFIRKDGFRFPDGFPDYLMVCDSLKTPAENVLQVLHPSAVCLPPKLPAYRRQQWKEACAAAGISLLDMGDCGMLKINIENQKNRCSECKLLKKIP